jgi:hypothetical protein
MIALFVSVVCNLVSAADEDERFIVGLRERRLFALAERYCEDRLAVAQLSTTDRVQLTVELIRVHAEQALNSPAEDRDAFWQKARDAASDFSDANNGQPRVVLVRVQDALTLLKRGELARMESEISPTPEESLAAARETLRQASQLLTKVDRELTASIPLRRRNSPQPDELSADELTALQYHVRFQLARALKNQALCFLADSSDRTASLTEALEQLKQPLAQLPPNDPLAVEVRLEQTACLRLIGDAQAAERYLQGLAGDDWAPGANLKIRAERIRLHLRQEQRDKSLAVISQGRKIAGVSSPELDFAFLETYLSMWKAGADAKDQTAASKWRDKSIATAEFIEQAHGPYWARRAELLLVRIGAGSGDGSIEILLRTADDLYKKGRLGDAVAAYDKAADAAQKASDDKHAFEFAYKAALVQQSRSERDDASRRFQQLATAHKTSPYAGNAHLLAIVNTRQASAQAGKWRAEYTVLLREHLDTWPNSATSSTAAFWLGELEAGRKTWKDAIDAYEKVSASSEHFEPAIQAVGQCWLQHLRDLERAEQPATEEAARAIAFFASVVNDADGGLPGQWSVAQRNGVRFMAAIDLQFGNSNLKETERLLRAALDGQPAASSDWRSTATSLLVVAVGRQEGRQAEASELLERIGETSTGELLALFEQFATLVDSANDATRRDLANLQVNIAELLRSKTSQLAAAQRVAVERGYAKALAAAGKHKEALAAFKELAQTRPQDGDVQEAYARLLLESGDEAAWRLALDQWRRVAARSKPRSPRWFRAKYSVAMTQFKLGDKQNAAKLIRYLKATEDLAQSGLERELEALLKRCQD